jgi:predicted TPR repeat methyltransferase
MLVSSLTRNHWLTKKIIESIPRGRVLNVGCGCTGTERHLFPARDYQIFGVDVSEEDLRILQGKKLYDALYKANISSLPFAQEGFDIV